MGTITATGGPAHAVAANDGGAGGRVTVSGSTISTGTINTTGGDGVGSGALGGAGGDISLTATGATPTLTLAGNLTTTGGDSSLGTAGNGGDVTLSGAVGLNAAITIDAQLGAGSGGLGGAVTFGGTVNGAQALTVNTTGTTTFNGVVGDVKKPTSLNVLNASGTTAINTTAITTGGAQTYAGAVTLGASPTLTASGDVTFGGTVTGAQALTVNASGRTTFSGRVGTILTPLTSLTTGGGGTTAINGGSIRTTGAQTYNEPVSLGANTTLTTANSLVTLGTVTGDGYTLSVNSGSGGVTLNGVTAAGLTLTTTGRETLNAGTYAIDADGSALSFTSTGGVTLNGSLTLNNATTFGSSALPSSAVTLGANTTLTGGTASDNITFGGAVNGARALTVNASGTTTFSSTVGVLTALTSVTTGAGGTTAINGGSIRTSGAQTYNDAVSLGANTTLTSIAGGNVTFGSTVSNTTSRTLTVNTSGTTTFGGAVGSGTALASVTTSAAGTTAINTTAIRTTGAQTYNDAVTLGASTTLTSTAGGNVTFGGTVDGAQALTVNTSGTTTFSGVVGGSSPPTSLSVTSGNLALNAGISANTILLRTTGVGADITVNNAITASGGGNSLVLATSADFINNAGASALNAGAGRWLVYSAPADPTTDTFGGLNSGNTAIWNASYATLPPSSVTQPGNRYLFTLAPTISFTSTNVTKTYGQDGSALVATAYAVSGLRPGVANAYLADTAATSFSGTLDITSLGTPPSASVSGSPYPINIAQGAAVGINGYTIGTFTSSGQLTVNRAPLTISADNKSKTFGSPNPPLTASYTGLVAGDTPAVVTGLSLATTATMGSPVGNYPITVSGGTADNYVITRVNGVLTVQLSTAHLDATMQVHRQSLDPGGLRQSVFGPSLNGNLSAGTVAIPATGSELATTAEFTGEAQFLKGFYRFINRFLEGRDLLSSVVCNVPISGPGTCSGPPAGPRP